MTHTEIAERLRVLADAPTLSIENRGELDRMANELDPPRPEPGTVVWWRDHAEMPWKIGITSFDGVLYINKSGYLHNESWDIVQYKPARILAPDEVAVKIPPTHEWGHRVTDVEIRLIYWDVDNSDHYERVRLIPRAEAMRMEKER